MSTDYDVIIIGSGAGGGTLFHALAPTGKRILLLERGSYVPREKANWSTSAVNLEGRYNTKEVWRDGAGRDLHPHTNYYVGGNTKFYGAALFRLRREDFGEIKHHDGISPAWPIAYEDLEPYYTWAEQLYHVHGERGIDPTDPPASAPYPHPAVSHEPRIQHLSDDMARLGLRPFHVPLGIMLDEQNAQKSRCIRCGTCDGHPCLIYAKSDAQVVCVDPTLARHPNATLLTGARVDKLKHLMKQQTKCGVHGHECHEGLFARNLFLGQRIPLAGVAHQNGTIRFGRDPKTSALDADCKAHELENLYVVDGSFFPSSGAVNPALTIMANALRVADHLKARLG